MIISAHTRDLVIFVHKLELSSAQAEIYKLNLDDITVDVAWNGTAARLHCDRSEHISQGKTSSALKLLGKRPNRQSASVNRRFLSICGVG